MISVEKMPGGRVAAVTGGRSGWICLPSGYAHILIGAAAFLVACCAAVGCVAPLSTGVAAGQAEPRITRRTADGRRVTGIELEAAYSSEPGMKKTKVVGPVDCNLVPTPSLLQYCVESDLSVPATCSGGMTSSESGRHEGGCSRRISSRTAAGGLDVDTHIMNPHKPHITNRPSVPVVDPGGVSEPELSVNVQSLGNWVYSYGSLAAGSAVLAVGLAEALRRRHIREG